MTPTAVDNPPSAPTGLSAAAAGSGGVNLSWTAATDDLGVATYEVERCQGAGCSGFVQVATTASTSLADTGLVASTSYSYRVRARDTGNQVGPYSSVASATTGSGSPPPSASLVAAYAFDEGSGTTVADASGNGNGGRVAGPTWTTSGQVRVGAVASTARARGCRSRTAASLDVTSAVTLEAWVYPAAAQSSWRAVVQKEADAYLLHASSERGGLRPAAGVTIGGVGADGVLRRARLPVGAWSHLAMTYDGSRSAPVRERRAGGERAADRVDRAVGEPVVDRRQQPVRRVLQRPDRRGAGVPRGALARRRSRPTWRIRSRRIPTRRSSSSRRRPRASTVDGRHCQHLVHDDGRSHRRRPRPLPGGQRPGEDGSLVRRRVLASRASTSGRTRLNGWLVRADHSKIARHRRGAGALLERRRPGRPDPADRRDHIAGERRDDLGNCRSHGGRRRQRRCLRRPVQARRCAARGRGPDGPVHDGSWDTTIGGNGSHVLTAIARDAAGHETTVCVRDGDRREQRLRSRRRSASGALRPRCRSCRSTRACCPNGKLLIFDSATNSGTNPRVWDPVARTFTQVPYNDTANLFCAGHTPLADGRILVVGGHVDAYVGLKNATIFDPATNTWTDVAADDNTPGGIRPSPGFPTDACSWCPARANCPDCCDARCAAHRHRRRAGDLRSRDQHLVDGHGRQPPAAYVPQHVRPPRRADLRRDDRGGGDREQGPRPHDQDVERGRQQRPRGRQLCHVSAREDPEDAARRGTPITRSRTRRPRRG